MWQDLGYPGKFKADPQSWFPEVCLSGKEISNPWPLTHELVLGNSFLYITTKNTAIEIKNHSGESEKI